MYAIDYVNNTSIIKQQPRMTAINSCIEVDLTGQVCSDSIGTRFFSGFGGQVDFIRGAAEGLDGKGVPIIAMPSITNKGESKIVPTLKTGNIFKMFNLKQLLNYILLFIPQVLVLLPPVPMSTMWSLNMVLPRCLARICVNVLMNLYKLLNPNTVKLWKSLPLNV